MARHPFLRGNLLFKGGTALKKCYFPDYRFSEDLDFTFLSENFDRRQVINEFEQVFSWIYEASRIRILVKDANELSTGNINFFAGHIGPLGGDGSKKGVKIDVGQDEFVYYDPVDVGVLSDYSDLDGSFSVKCYRLEEIVAEKMRSLMQRTIPRDLYALWYLLEVEELDIEDCIPGFQAKTIFKMLNPDDFINKVSSKQESLKKQWTISLSHQVAFLSDFDAVWRDFNKHLRRFAKYTGKQ